MRARRPYLVPGRRALVWPEGSLVSASTNPASVRQTTQLISQPTSEIDSKTTRAEEEYNRRLLTCCRGQRSSSSSPADRSPRWRRRRQLLVSRSWVGDDEPAPVGLIDGSSEPPNPGRERVYMYIYVCTSGAVEKQAGGVTYTDMVIIVDSEREGEGQGQGQAGGDGARRVRGGRQPLARWLLAPACAWIACQAASCVSVSVSPPPHRPRACLAPGLGCFTRSSTSRPLYFDLAPDLSLDYHHSPIYPFLIVDVWCYTAE